jgi:DeoR family transcriptional regulator, suf operon transcriptional repressor
MQETRRQILEILFNNGKATVDEIASNLRQRRKDSITSVTVRHHLSKLQDEGLVSAPRMRRRSSPGRPHHIYQLTNHGSSFFPNNYEQMTIQLVKKINSQLSPSTANVILEGIADDMATEADIPEGNIEERLEAVVLFLNSKGYDAKWEANTNGFILSTSSCPYHHVAQESESLCQLDMRLISKMLGIVPRLQSRISHGDDICSFLIPHNTVN